MLNPWMRVVKKCAEEYRQEKEIADITKRYKEPPKAKPKPKPKAKAKYVSDVVKSKPKPKKITEGQATKGTAPKKTKKMKAVTIAAKTSQDAAESTFRRDSGAKPGRIKRVKTILEGKATKGTTEAPTATLTINPVKTAQSAHAAIFIKDTGPKPGIAKRVRPVKKVITEGKATKGNADAPTATATKIKKKKAKSAYTSDFTDFKGKSERVFKKEPAGAPGAKGKKLGKGPTTPKPKPKGKIQSATADVVESKSGKVEVDGPPATDALKETSKQAECLASIDKLTKGLYSTKKPNIKTFENLLEHSKFRDKIMEVITSGDFYPTPPEYGEAILRKYEEAADPTTTTAIIDVGAGLCSLSIPFIKKGYNCVLVEQNKFLYDVIECLKGDKVAIMNEDYFKLDIQSPLKDEIAYLCNPPFRAHINGKMEKQAYLFFLVSIISKIRDPTNHQGYIIVPPNNEVFKTELGRSIDLDNDKGKTIDIIIKGAVWKRISQFLGVSSDNDYFEYYYCSYIEKVEGFKGLTSKGGVRSAPDAMLIKVGY